MQADLTGLQKTVQELVLALNRTNVILDTLFPTADATVSTTYTNGTFAAMPTQYEAMLVVTVAGVVYKIPMVKA